MFIKNIRRVKGIRENDSRADNRKKIENEDLHLSSDY
jgi:hypothetical protein